MEVKGLGPVGFLHYNQERAYRTVNKHSTRLLRKHTIETCGQD
jgi:hypothetical protein